MTDMAANGNSSDGSPVREVLIEVRGRMRTSNLGAKATLLEPPDREAWGRWLEDNHATSSGVWLAVGKKSGRRTSLTYDDAVEEALRFGWIDSTVRRLDDQRFMQLFTPRRPNSTWAASNKERARRLTTQGLMRPAGLAAIEAAKSNGSWDLLEDVENEVVPDDLDSLFGANPELAEAFGALTSSQRRMTLYWIASAKRRPTRDARIARTLAALEEGRSPV